MIRIRLFNYCYIFYKIKCKTVFFFFLFNRGYHIDLDFISLVRDSNDNALKLKSICDDAFKIFETSKKRNLKHIIYIYFI